MTSLPVNELFQTIQGEATYAGTPAVFIRLQGCPVGCPWCDTRYTWDDPTIAPEVSTGAIVLKPSKSADFAWFDLDQMIRLLDQYRARHVVITGGEPCIHDLTPLTDAVIETGRTVQIETSGTHPIRCHPMTWVTVSPKINMPGGFPVLDEALARADEIKMPVGKSEDVVALFDLLHHCPATLTDRIWLQPLSLSRKATDLCVETATANGYRVSIQTHALAGWR
jgi:7-carboxy-7-deazaguanine synthase